LLAEYGIVIRQGANHLRKHLPLLIGDEENNLSPLMRHNLSSLYESLCFFDRQIAGQEAMLKAIVRENEACQRLLKVPGIGLLGSTLLFSVAGAASNFKNGREFAAYLGLVPRQSSTGGKTKLLGISKRGDSYMVVAAFANP
jgi:transposase